MFSQFPWLLDERGTILSSVTKISVRFEAEIFCESFTLSAFNSLYAFTLTWGKEGRNWRWDLNYCQHFFNFYDAQTHKPVSATSPVSLKMCLCPRRALSLERLGCITFLSWDNPQLGDLSFWHVLLYDALKTLYRNTVSLVHSCTANQPIMWKQHRSRSIQQQNVGENALSLTLKKSCWLLLTNISGLILWCFSNLRQSSLGEPALCGLQFPFLTDMIGTQCGHLVF